MPSVTVVGSGIVGLTSAIILQEKGLEVTIVAKERFDDTLSSKVGAIWFPFEIEPKEKTNTWASLAYERYQNDLEPKNGVAFIPFLTAYNNYSNNDWTQTLPKETVRKAKPSELPKGIKTAFISIVPLAEPRLYLPYLFEKFIKNGGHFEEREIKDLKELAALNTLVINCTGLGAKNLCNDEDLQPMRGQILRCKKMNTPSFADSTKKGALSYIINRSNDCVIGGTDYENDWNRNVEASDTTLILNRLNTIGYNENPPEILEEIVGLRPKRRCVRFEFDDTFRNIFHNYGHGGAGFTVAWGCGIELGELLTKKN
ncbi:D-amino-acid:oxygen oxidoreductase (deaminating) [Winogradskyella pacifica]|uniref:D-amino-acid oxidase n=1 Tax=Winogradskyella pacifica TaxID=664642 RepID=A0A3D9MZX2_9FLAO|nr:FAD-dependent oxidoreductase [Winogradskyella pacifica]REE24815.1 D-amino-acid:oxygen oxidoreductase (deaminating) [Winogradskyella pacifica]